MLLSELPVGSLVKDPDSKYDDIVLLWRILEHGHEGDPAGSTSLECYYALSINKYKSFDAKEPNNPNSTAQNYGNHIYKFSNLLQWLNKEGSNWYTPQHEYDAAPSTEYVERNPYDTEDGFLSGLSSKFKKILMEASKPTYLSTTRETELVTSKMFLLSGVEVNQTISSTVSNEGSVYEYYSLNNVSYKPITPNNSSSTAGWYLRTGYNGFVFIAINNSTSNMLPYAARNGGSYPSPACCVPQTLKVFDTPDTDGAYIIQWSTEVSKFYIGINGHAVPIPIQVGG